MQETGQRNANHGADKFGFNGLNRVHWNLLEPHLYEHAIRNGEVPGIDRDIRIIALTAYAMPTDRARCLAAGMDDYVAKPLRVPELQAALARVGHPATASDAGPAG